MNHFQLKFTRDGTKDLYLEPLRNKSSKTKNVKGKPTSV